MYQKVVVSGDVIEVYTMDYEPYSPEKKDKKYNPFDFQPMREHGSEQLSVEAIDRALFLRDNRLKWERVVKECRKEERRKQTTRDSRNLVRRLALSNFDKNSKFITLTFKENVTDIDFANEIFKKFVRRLRKHCDGDFKYISVIEFQKRGAVHYHMLCNLQYTPHEKLLEWWRNSGSDGSINVKNIDNIDNVGAYIVKYMMKNAGDKRLKGRKMYLCSKGLVRPKVYSGYSAELVIKTYLEKEKEIYTNSYDSEYLGKIVYKEYNLKADKKYRETLEELKELEKKGLVEG